MFYILQEKRDHLVEGLEKNLFLQITLAAFLAVVPMVLISEWGISPQKLFSSWLDGILFWLGFATSVLGIAMLVIVGRKIYKEEKRRPNLKSFLEDSKDAFWQSLFIVLFVAAVFEGNLLGDNLFEQIIGFFAIWVASPSAIAVLSYHWFYSNKNKRTIDEWKAFCNVLQFIAFNVVIYWMSGDIEVVAKIVGLFALFNFAYLLVRWKNK